GGEVRLKYAYIIKCESFLQDPVTGEVTEIHCTYEPDTRSGMPNSNKKVKGTLHWAAVSNSVKSEVRLYDRLFVKETPEDVEEGQDFKVNLNPDSLKVVTAYCEPAISQYKPGDKVQFERMGYFCVDQDSTETNLVINRTTTLKDNWAKIAGKE
ncbi:MAG TPA: glutamine--tRNA ligase, partial [Bacteroidales bacterium]|nr:glutamine--tRNA ligase [Bacteroidales bacterium]